MLFIAEKIPSLKSRTNPKRKNILFFSINLKCSYLAYYLLLHHLCITLVGSEATLKQISVCQGRLGEKHDFLGPWSK